MASSHPNSGAEAPAHLGVAGTVARAFIDSKLTPLIILTSILLGVGAVLKLPREEEPQIKVPMVDVMVSMPGSSAKELEERVTRPMEKLLWEIAGVEYIYSISRPGESLVIVRFKVGEDIEDSLVKLNQKLQQNFDRIPHGVSFPLIKPKSIDDVPILALTLHSPNHDHLTLRRLAAQVDDAVKQVPMVAETMLIGGARRQVRVQLDPVKLASRNLSAAGLIPMLQQANRQYAAGGLTSDNREIAIETGGFLTRAEEVGQIVVGVFQGRPVYLREVADILDGPEEPSQYVFFGRGAARGVLGREEPAVTLTVAKRPGANAIDVAKEVLRKVDTLKGTVIPADVDISITRHYGETAAEKSNELLFHMAIAVVSVSLLIMVVLGWRESGIVALAIPSTLALTLLVFYLYGFTLNRITLFALIFSIGILVDDAIVVVENIVRHYHLPHNRGRNLFTVAVEAVGEVGNPTILATFAVIFAVLPMAFVGGLMGPYMRPIPIGASAAMFFSLAIAFMVTPWAAVRLLKQHALPAASAPAGSDGPAPQSPHSHFEHEEDFFTRLYRRMMGPLITHWQWRWAFLVGIVILLLASMATVGLGWVKVKMLPFDNKSEFQIVLNMPEGSALEVTAQAAREIAAAVRTEPEVTDYQVYAGIAAPFNFNGLVRHYFNRRGAHVADIQVNLVNKHQRKAQSHDIAKRVRPRVTEIARRYGARVAVTEVPPGPPVLQTLVAEIYGPSEEARLALAEEVKKIFQSTPGVVDVDWYIEADQPKARFVIDKEKAALHGISAETISQTLRIAVSGLPVDLVHLPREKEDVPLVLEVPRQFRTLPEELLALRVRSGDANALPEPGRDAPPPLVPLRELVKVEYTLTDKSIHHKNLMPVTYVIGDVAGEAESPVYAILQMNQKLRQIDPRQFGGSVSEFKIYNAVLPFTEAQPAMKWDGEWHITIEVFRDLGLAFGAVCILIYLLMVGWFRSFVTPLVVMAAIPFSLVGILPAHGALHAFFTATSMIGFMAGGGIVVRNSIILVDFIEQRLREGMPLAEAVVDAGAVRFRPMLLTAMAVVVGASVILFDPIFQGLAISLMAGEIASLLISRMAVPVLYYMVNRKKSAV
ncbi:efflux RND transporter permease subunit [Fontisphaera persica]|uniref:efflux RND transporter permease subunit n=1 Tax=Fontisphaera persica TaxID=2974023 RepID=UPI0024C0E541|nr:efflux RND transporter permease subunit [Fontisphaera persica]WCJ59387.1 efflux RND transporter permease subunit [Fontisphaera persica]